MPLIEANMSLGQLRLEKARLQLVFWNAVHTFNCRTNRMIYPQYFYFHRLKAYRRMNAIGSHLDILSEELDHRTYDHASKIRVVNFKPEG